MTTLIQLNYGDTSGDGHEKTDNVIISSSVTESVLYGYMNSKVVKDVFDMNTECSEYEECKLSYHCTKNLRELGIIEEDYDEDRHSAWRGDYVNILLSVVEYFYPDFKYTFVRLDSIDVGGYGAI